MSIVIQLLPNFLKVKLVSYLSHHKVPSKYSNVHVVKSVQSSHKY